jgi:YD repeat-containing protein
MKIKVKLFISVCFLIFVFCSNQLQADNITYKYDELNRIIQVIYDDGTTVTYTYDKVGNRLIKNVSFTQETVSTPSISRGLTRRFQGTQYSYLVRGSSSSLHHPVQYFIDWGDGTDSGWLAVGKTSVIKAWTSGGTYLIKAQARCATHTDIVSNWSTFLSVDIIGPPSAATLISPTGTVTDTIPTYTWNAVSNAAWYHLWVNDQTANKINAWYTAEACGCAAGTCTITPATEVIGSCQWWVQTYNSAGFGPWSSGMTFTAPIPTVPPGAATQVSPTGAITDTTPTYTWNAVSGASWYCLYVNDSTGNKINQWYTRGEAGCASGTGTCSVTPTTEVRGSSQWWVRTYNPAGFGPWSTPMAFTVSP